MLPNIRSLAVTPVIALLFVSCMTACNDDGTRTVSQNVPILPCFSKVEHWYTALEYQKATGNFPSDDSDTFVSLVPGDRVQTIESHLVDEQPGLVDVTGEVEKVKVISGNYSGTTCWVWSGSSPNGPMFN